MIYAIIKTAVYQHGVFGVYHNLEDAKETAKILAKNDIDAHHSYDVTETTIDSPPQVKFDEVYGCDLLSEKVIFSVNKNGILKDCDD